MKNIKRIASMLLALIVVLSMMTVAFAADANGTITINGVELDTNGNLTNTYTIYKMLDLESYTHTENESGIMNEAYSYKVVEAWKPFFTEGEGKNYMTVDANGYAAWIETVGEAPSTVVAFAKAALAYAKATSAISPVKSSANAADIEKGVVKDSEGNDVNYIKFKDLELGYYLIDSTMGALCGLTTTNPDGSLNAKNSQPTIDKQVLEDSTNQWGNENTADVGQTVDFRATIYVHAGAENYVLHDEMTDGLTFDPDSVKINHVVPGTTDETGTPVPAKYYEVVTEDLEDACDFEIHFTQAFCDHLKTNDKVIVTYSATLNENAVVAGNGNINETWLDFGENHHTTHDSTVTKTYGFDLIKTNSENKLIPGAEFQLYDVDNGGEPIQFVAAEKSKNDQGEETQRVKIYRRATQAEIDNPDVETVTNIVVWEGAVRVIGLDNGTYYLYEDVTPTGYNKLSARQEFTISDSNLNATFNDNVYSSGSGVQVVNKSGTMLPETGGVGTTLFYVFGGVLVAAAVVLLVTRKRMSEK